MFSVIELQVLTMGLSDMGFCVFFRKYMCGVAVLDKGCGGIHVPVLDDDYGALVCFVYDDSIMDDKLFQCLSLFVCWVVFGFQVVVSLRWSSPICV